MPGAWIRCAVLVLAGLTTACGGTSRVGDGLTATSLTQSRKGVALIKLGAADPSCTVLSAGIGVREGGDFRIVQTARIERNNASETAVAELELGSGEYHVVSYSCVRRGGAIQLAEPAGNGLYKKSYASFSLASGEVLNVGYLQLVPMGAAQVAYTRVLAVRLAVTDWPLSELERFKQQRPNLYAQMRTRLMAVPKVEPPTLEQVRAQCAEMKRLQAEGKLQNLPLVCTPGGTKPLQQQPAGGKRQIGA
jgi:hypothetical protein